MVLTVKRRETFMRRGLASNFVVAMASLVMVPLCGAAQPDYGYDWLTVGAPGNRSVTEQEGPRFFPPYQIEPMNVGAVGREYRMTQTQVTVGQWFEFVNTYWPYYDEGNFVSDFTGNWIWAENHNPGPGEDPGFYMTPGSENYPTDMSWRYAARYVNWLHNEKVTEQWAFENGAYDTSTFGFNDDGTITDQREHHPDAKFWIPTLDEWVKGMYYDPDRYGPGEEGYWKYPDGGQEPLIPGYPDEGGETSAGIPDKYGNEPYLDVGSYPHVTSRWGFLDGSGAEQEWTEAVVRDRRRIFKGSRQFQGFPDFLDRVDDFGASFPVFGGIGLRLASTVPAPPTFLVAAVFMLGMKRRRTAMPIAACVLAAATSGAAAQPDYGYDWLTVGAPGNRSVTEQEGPTFFPPYQNEPMYVGAVGRKYRMTQTQVTVGQWFEFVNTYWPYYDEGNFVSDFTGNWIWAENHNPGPGEDPGFYMTPGSENYPTDMSWRYAARYVNWLHNEKNTEQWAFENGAYDTSTFGYDDDGLFTDQREHNPDAKFWIPTLDEWVKGMYYDPDRYGPGEEGYWKYPDGGQEPLIPGYPWEGGETSAGIPNKYGNEPYLDVGSYPHVTSPWGFLDGSGGEQEWTEAVLRDRRRIAKGSRQFQGFPDFLDRVDDFSARFPSSGGIGLRLASTVPAPPTFLVVVGIAFIYRRRRDETYDSESVDSFCVVGKPGVRSMRCPSPMESDRERLRRNQ